MKKWFKFHKTINGKLVAEEYTEYGEWAKPQRIYEDFLDWKEGVMWKQEAPNSKYEYCEVDIPSKEWLENVIDRNKSLIFKVESENSVFNNMLQKYTIGYKVKTLIEKIKS